MLYADSTATDRSVYPTRELHGPLIGQRNPILQIDGQYSSLILSYTART